MQCVVFFVVHCFFAIPITPTSFSNLHNQLVNRSKSRTVYTVSTEQKIAKTIVCVYDFIAEIAGAYTMMECPRMRQKNGMKKIRRMRISIELYIQLC